MTTTQWTGGYGSNAVATNSRAHAATVPATRGVVRLRSDLDARFAAKLRGVVGGFGAVIPAPSGPRTSG
ncbi:hypothetical protein [Aquipuribacter nitratireducens]|uniref:Uncharacterized protein n=1 Tax=Aquipuribacter nitratireducens TaxID=650104 RepID=A0ABW0GM82_9MICO